MQVIAARICSLRALKVQLNQADGISEGLLLIYFPTKIHHLYLKSLYE
jgi:hypothetical protein